MEGKVMMVDDDPDILTTVRTIFESEGLDILTVGSGKECVNELKRGFKGVILMDIMMPRMDGWDTIQTIVDEGLIEGNIISMLTAKDAPDQIMEELAENVVDYITKPFDADELISTVRGYLSFLD